MSVLAFPTAIGAGANITGGRGQTVYHVTNLSGNINTSGSFPWALKQAADNYGGNIVFDISGVITLEGNYTNSSGGDPACNIRDAAYPGGPRSSRTNVNISVMGQTAPFPGITIDTQDAKLRFEDIHNIVFRYIKFRCTNASRSFWANQYVDKFVVDHCSFAYTSADTTSTTFGSFGNWTASSGYLPDEITVQNCFFAHGDRTTNLGNTAGTDGVFGNVTMARNVFHEMGYRTPLKTGGTGQRDLINNIISKTRNGKRISRFDNQGLNINHIGNIYTPSVSNQQETNGNGIDDGHKIYTDNIAVDNFIYNNDNDLTAMSIVPDSGTTGDTEKDFWDAFRPSGNEGDPDIPASWFVNTQHTLAGKDFEIYSSANLKEAILDDVGSCRYLNDNGEVVYYRDAIDTRYADDVLNNTDRALEASTGWASFGDSTSNTRPAGFYNTNDHIPEAYFTARGITGTSTIHNEVQSSGYTLLEEYANQVDSAGQLAFPTAVGAGAYATGGRGGKVCHVDTLTWDTAAVYDAATDSYSGGFYNMFYELDIPAKEIVFNVSGTIVVPSYTVLNFASKTNEGNITVSGQTSNIVFSTDYFQIQNAKNLIWRYTSFYKRDDQAPGSDVLWVNSSENDITENIIFDHCSFYYGGDECFSVTSSNGEVNNVTAQWCLMAASSKGSIIGAYTGQSNATTAYCSYQDISYRFPNMLGYGSNSQQDAYNIFVGNYTSRLIRTTGDANFNVQNMYVQANRANYGKHRMQYQSTAPCQLYAGGTIITGVQDTPAYPEFDDVWTTFSGSDIGADLAIPNDARASSAFPLIGKAGTIYDTADVKTEVLPYTGNTKRLANDGSVVEDEYALDTFYRDLGINKVSTSDQTRYPTTQYP